MVVEEEMAVVEPEPEFQPEPSLSRSFRLGQLKARPGRAWNRQSLSLSLNSSQSLNRSRSLCRGGARINPGAGCACE